MCGIHAVVNKGSYARTVYEGFIKDGFVAGSLRGMDSSGIMQIDKAGKPYMFKLATPGPQFIESKLASGFFRDAPSCPVTVAHVRAATMGRVTSENAHPFCVNRPDGTRLIGVHNGTLIGWSYKKDGAKYDVDSEWALNMIAKEGADAFELFQGAWAMVWWDEKFKDKLFVARNTERPLHFLRSKDKSGMLMASEAGMLAWLAERNRIDTEDTVYTFEPGKLYTIDHSGNELKWTKSSYPVYKSQYSTYTPAGMGNNNTRSHWNPANARWEDRRGSGHSCDYNMGLDPGEGTLGGTLGSPPLTEGKKQQVECGKEALEVIGAVKSALSDNRDKRFRRGKYAPDKQTPTAEPAANSVDEPKGKDTSKKNRDEDTPDVYHCKPDWYSVQPATTAERNEAAELGVMGELQFFTGIEFDPETSELLGEIEDFVSGSGKIKYDAVMRMVTRVEANAYSIAHGKGCWCAVIGKGVDKKLNSVYFVVAPLNEKGQRELRDRAAA